MRSSCSLLSKKGKTSAIVPICEQVVPICEQQEQKPPAKRYCMSVKPDGLQDPYVDIFNQILQTQRVGTRPTQWISTVLYEAGCELCHRKEVNHRTRNEISALFECCIILNGIEQPQDVVKYWFTPFVDMYWIASIGVWLLIAEYSLPDEPIPLKLCKTIAFCYNQVGIALYHKKQFREALYYFIRNDNSEYACVGAINQSLCYSLIGEPAKAMASINTATQNTTDPYYSQAPYYYQARAMAYFGIHDYERAEPLFLLAIQNHTDAQEIQRCIDGLSIVQLFTKQKQKQSKKPICDWDTSDMVKWLQSIGSEYNQYIKMFVSNGVTGAALLANNKNQLQEILIYFGVNNAFHRTRMITELLAS